MLKVFVIRLSITVSQQSAVSVTTTKLVVNTVQRRKRNELARNELFAGYFTHD